MFHFAQWPLTSVCAFDWLVHPLSWRLVYKYDLGVYPGLSDFAHSTCLNNKRNVVLLIVTRGNKSVIPPSFSNDKPTIMIWPFGHKMRVTLMCKSLVQITNSNLTKKHYCLELLNREGECPKAGQSQVTSSLASVNVTVTPHYSKAIVFWCFMWEFSSALDSRKVIYYYFSHQLNLFPIS